MRAARAGPVLRCQRFASEQILRGPALAARKGPVQACLQGSMQLLTVSSCCTAALVASHHPVTSYTHTEYILYILFI